MDFDIELADQPEFRTFRKDVSSWLRTIMASASEYRWTSPHTARQTYPDLEFRWDLIRRLGERGWLFPTFPVEYGGLGLSWEYQVIIEEEIARYGLSVRRLALGSGTRDIAAALLQLGSDEQKRTFLGGLVRGEFVVWSALTEPQGGSDLATCLTKAKRNGDQYVITGQKVMVGHVGRVDFWWCTVCTDFPGKRHENMSCVLIPARAPGVTTAPMRMMGGVKNSLYLDEVRVPAKNLIGGENNGWNVAKIVGEQVHGGRGSIHAEHGTPVDRIIAYCRTATFAGQPLLHDAAVRDTLAEIIVDAHVQELLDRRNLWHRLTGRPHQYGGSQVMYLNRMVRLRNAERLQQIIGYDALVREPTVHEELEFEHLTRVGPGRLHGGGTQDTDRLIMARRLGLGRPASETAPVTHHPARAVHR